MKKLFCLVVLLMVSSMAIGQIRVTSEGYPRFPRKPIETSISDNDTILVTKIDGIAAGISFSDFKLLLPSGGGNDLELTGNLLELTNPITPGNSIDLSPYLDAPTPSEIVTALNGQVGNTRWSVVEVPTGGATGQVLKKDTNSDFDYSWQDDEGGVGGTSSDLNLVGDILSLTNPTTPGNQVIVDGNPDDDVEAGTNSPFQGIKLWIGDKAQAAIDEPWDDPQYANGLVIVTDSVALPEILSRYSIDANNHIQYRNDIIIPEGVTYVKERGFFNSGITSVSLPSTLDSIGASGFANSAIEDVVIPDNVQIIDEKAFQNNRITTLDIGSGVRSIRSAAFSNNVITSISAFPSTLDSIGPSAFSISGSLGAVVIPSTVEYIGNIGFGNSGITSLTLNEGLTYLGDYAFNGNDFTTVTIPSTVTLGTTNQRIFQNTPLESMTINCPVIPSLFMRVPSYNSPILTTLTLNEGVLTIDTQSFYGQSGIITLTTPSSLNSIGVEAFKECTSLTTIVFGDGLETIGNLAFTGCSSLSSVTFPTSVTSIGSGAFTGTALTSVSLPTGITLAGIAYPSTTGEELVFGPSVTVTYY